MRRCVLFLVSFLVLTVAGTGFAQDAPTLDVRLLVAQALGAMGGGAPADSVATGTLTLYAGGMNEAQPFKVTTRGLHEYREERSTVNGIMSRTFSNSRAFSVVGGEKVTYSGENAFNDYCPYFPLAGIIGDIADSDIAVEYVGSEVEADRTLHHIRLWNTFASKETLSELGVGKYTTTDVWLDAATLLPAGVSYNVYAINGSGEPIPVELHFEEYQEFGGKLYPTKIIKFLNGTHYADIEITQVQFDTGITDADLDLD